MISLRGMMLAALLLPFAEFITFSLVASKMGFLSALVLIFLGSFIGITLLRREGARLFAAMRQNGGLVLTGGQARDQLLIGLGGLLLAIPGFLTDVLGLLCLIPALSTLLSGRQLSAARPAEPGVIELERSEWRDLPPRG
jgi:UPF0716 protein FxsA